VGNSSTEGCCTDPYAPGVAEAYGLNDKSGIAGFDSASDSVGPGIYGGSVQRDDSGNILIGAQYENHNHVPGPLYDGNGYSLMGRAIHIGPDKVKELLDKYPQLLEEISTGGARPLHICGMSGRGQHCTQILIDAGADIHALDTYNYNALHRMASNDLEIGAEALVQAGLDPNLKDDRADSTPIDIAKRQRAIKFLMKMQKMGHYD
jgi:ankyrin repeat protein